MFVLSSACYGVVVKTIQDYLMQGFTVQLLSSPPFHTPSLNCCTSYMLA